MICYIECWHDFLPMMWLRNFRHLVAVRVPISSSISHTPLVTSTLPTRQHTITMYNLYIFQLGLVLLHLRHHLKVSHCLFLVYSNIQRTCKLIHSHTLFVLTASSNIGAAVGGAVGGIIAVILIVAIVVIIVVVLMLYYRGMLILSVVCVCVCERERERERRKERGREGERGERTGGEREKSMMCG